MRRACLLLLLSTACFADPSATETGGTSTGVGSTSTTATPTTGSAPTSDGTTTTTGTGSGAGTGTGSSTGTGEETSSGASSITETGDPTGEPPPPLELTRFAVIGDYGLDGSPSAKVAALVAGWDPEFVITVGDNNYPDGLASTIDDHIGQHYSSFIAPYKGTYGPGASENRFFPCPGNHDWNSGTLKPYLDYFTLPGNERYYALRRGPVEFFLIDSDSHEPDGIDPDGVQGQWLEEALAESTASFQVVVMHHAPYSSGDHEGNNAMRWPYAAWGADLVLAGHDHDYERLMVDGLPYIVTGTAGAALRPFVSEEKGSQRGHATAFGAMRVEASEQHMTLDFIDVGGERIDRFTLVAEPPTSWQPRVPTGATWQWREKDAAPGWQMPGFAADDWQSGPAPLGFGLGGEATVLPGGMPDARPIATYFRHEFTADAADLGPWLRLRIAVDDGAVVYLNGVEVYRINLPEGPVDADTPASLAVGSWFESRLAQTIIPGDALVAGDNVLAVEVHQAGPGSSDLHLDLALAVAGE